MSEIRYGVWSSKMAKHKINNTPTLKSLPPTSAAFGEHVSHAHHQKMIWMSALSSQPSQADPEQYGWTNVDGQLFPVMLPGKVSPVPADVLHTIKCGCASAEPCSSSRCSCVQAQISCSMFCTDHAEKECSNVHTRTCSTLPSDDEDVDDD